MFENGGTFPTVSAKLQVQFSMRRPWLFWSPLVLPLMAGPCYVGPGPWEQWKCQVLRHIFSGSHILKQPYLAFLMVSTPNCSLALSFRTSEVFLPSACVTGSW